MHCYQESFCFCFCFYLFSGGGGSRSNNKTCFRYFRKKVVSEKFETHILKKTHCLDIFFLSHKLGSFQFVSGSSTPSDKHERELSTDQVRDLRLVVVVVRFISTPENRSLIPVKDILVHISINCRKLKIWKYER